MDTIVCTLCCWKHIQSSHCCSCKWHWHFYSPPPLCFSVRCSDMDGHWQQFLEHQKEYWYFKHGKRLRSNCMCRIIGISFIHRVWLLDTFTRLGQSDIDSSEVSATLECYVCALYMVSRPNSSDVNAVRYKINNDQSAWCVTSWSWMGTWWRNFKCSMVWGITYTSTCSKWLIRRGYQYWRWTDAPGIIRWSLINSKTLLSWQMMYQYNKCLKRYLTWFRFIWINLISSNHLCQWA